MGRTEFLTPTIRSEPWVGKRKPTKRAKWRSFYECMQECAQNLVDTADIVRDGDFAPTMAPSVTSAEGSAVEKELRLGMIGSNLRCRSTIQRKALIAPIEFLHESSP